MVEEHELCHLYQVDLFDRYAEMIWDAFTQPSSYQEKIENFPQNVAEICAVYMLTAEVMNGGFSQYFHNSYGAMFNEAIVGFEMTEGTEFANIVRSAGSKFVDGVPIDRRLRMAMVDELESIDEDTWADDGDAFYSVNEEVWERHETKIEEMAKRLLMETFH